MTESSRSDMDLNETSADDQVDQEPEKPRKSGLSVRGKKLRIGPKSKIAKIPVLAAKPALKRSARIALISAAKQSRPIIAIPRVQIPVSVSVVAEPQSSKHSQKTINFL